MSRLVELTGKVFGRLIVLNRDLEKEKSIKSNSTCWLCLCECGNKISVRSSCLVSGKTKSCGCLNKEKTIEKNKKYNIYDLTGEYGIGYTTKDEKFYFDLEDYDKIKKYSWYIGSAGYAITTYNRKAILMHRIIMNPAPCEYVDHIYGIKTDNRKSHLRLVTSSQNSQNSKTSSSNTSGRKGVREYRNGKWCYEIWYNHKRERKFGYLSFDDAVKAREEAEIRLHGEFVRKQKED